MIRDDVEVSKKFWTGKKVLITGHTGFKGTWLSFWLSRMGANIKGIALEPATDPSLFDLVIRDDDLESTLGDIRNLDFLREEIESFSPDIIIHLAAQSIVRESYEYPISTFQTNIMGTANVLEAARSVDNIRAILCITSDKCYENREWLWKYRECDSMGGWDPYSASKGCSELVIASYRKSFFDPELYSDHGVAVASARAGNVIGGGDWAPNRLVPDIMRSFSNDEPVIIRNPEAIRPWQHVLDVLRGYILLVERLYEKGEEFAEAWNFGPSADNEKTVRHVVEYLADKWGDGASWHLDKQKNPHETSILRLDSSKARNEIDWNPILPLDRSLELVTDWYKEFYQDRGSARIVTERQIRNYEQMMNQTKAKVVSSKMQD